MYQEGSSASRLTIWKWNFLLPGDWLDSRKSCLLFQVHRQWIKLKNCIQISTKNAFKLVQISLVLVVEIAWQILEKYCQIFIFLHQKLISMAVEAFWRTHFVLLQLSRNPLLIILHQHQYHQSCHFIMLLIIQHPWANLSLTETCQKVKIVTVSSSTLLLLSLSSENLLAEFHSLVHVSLCSNA